MLQAVEIAKCVCDSRLHILHSDGEGARLHPVPTCCDWRSFRLMGRPVLVYSRSTTLAAKGPVGADMICQSKVWCFSFYSTGSPCYKMSESYWTVSEVRQSCLLPMGPK